MTTSYTPAPPATWLLLVTGDAVLYTEAAAATAVDELWSALAGPAPVQATLDILTRNGLGSAPSFALGQIVAGNLHALVRGPLVLTAMAASGAQAIDGTGVSTWRETTVDGVTALGVGEGSGQLPIGSGVVWAAGFSFQPAGAPVAAAPAPTAQPVAQVVEPVEIVAPEPAVEPPAPVIEPVEIPTPPPAPEPDLPSEHTMVEREDEPEPVVVPEPPQITPPPAEDSSYSHLFEETVHRSIEEAAIREEEPEEEDAAGPAHLLGDHDGETVMSADISELRKRRRAEATPAAAPEARAIYLELPNNQRESLEQPVIIGRSPSVSQVSGTELPRLVSIPGSQDISRNHARFAVEGGTVVVTDLHSRNGTSVALPGKPPQLLRKGEPTAVLPGTVVDLGGGVSLTVREG